jgi:hypothetical protein
MHAHKQPANLAEVMMVGLPGGIERQEAAGQAELCRAEVLPKDCPRATLEAFGVKFGDDHDELFVNVTLPAGWAKRATDHAMYSDLLDDKGRKRASIFYKAAFYDRRADMHVVRRYSVNVYLDGSDKDHYRGAVLDGTTEIHGLGEVMRDRYEEREGQRKQGIAWLTERFPRWEDATAYWD